MALVCPGGNFIMDGILIRNNFSKDEETEIIAGAVAATGREHDLARRAHKDFECYIRRKEMFCLFSGKELAGFVIKKNIGADTDEIQGLYIKPAFRGRKLSDILMNAVAGEKGIKYLAATYSGLMGKKLVMLGFEEIPFESLSLGTKVGFWKSRLRFGRIAGIIKSRCKNKKVKFFLK